MRRSQEILTVTNLDDPSFRSRSPPKCIYGTPPVPGAVGGLDGLVFASRNANDKLLGGGQALRRLYVFSRALVNRRVA